MTDSTPAGYHIGNVGAGAQVAQGEHISQTMLQAGVGLDDLRAVFDPVLRAIDTADDLDDDEREVAREAVQEVVEATEHAQEDPSALRRALTKSRKLLGNAWGRLVEAMNSETVQKTLGTITEATVQAGIKSLIG
jgi:hypothetical protein